MDLLHGIILEADTRQSFCGRNCVFVLNAVECSIRFVLYDIIVESSQ